MKYLIVSALALGVSGCANLADVLLAAGKDPASVCSSVMTVYGSLKFARTATLCAIKMASRSRASRPVCRSAVQIVPAK